MSEEKDNRPTFTTPEEKALRVIISQGRPAVLLKSMEPDEIATLAEMIDEHGEPAGAGDGLEFRERFRLFMVAFNDARKASDAEDDAPEGLPTGF